MTCNEWKPENHIISKALQFLICAQFNRWQQLCVKWMVLTKEKKQTVNWIIQVVKKHMLVLYMIWPNSRKTWFVGLNFSRLQTNFNKPEAPRIIYQAPGNNKAYYHLNIERILKEDQQITFLCVIWPMELRHDLGENCLSGS